MGPTTNKHYIQRLQQVIQHLHKCSATWVECVPVKEDFQGQTVWQDEVEPAECNIADNEAFVKLFTNFLRCCSTVLLLTPIWFIVEVYMRMKKLALSLLVVVLTGSWQIASAGDVTGTVTLKGSPLPEKTIDFGDVCGALPHDVKTTRYFILGKDNGLGDVFVYISKGLEGQKFTAPTTPVVINQEGCMYYPYVSGAMVGQPVEFKNSDTFMHNVHGLPRADGNSEFNIAEVSQGDVNDTKFASSITKPEVLVKVKCDVHPWMFCYVGVQDNPFFAVTDKDGHYKISNVPAGTYTLTAYHLKTHGGTPGVSQQITVAAGAVTADFAVDAPTPK
jgi:plastocyanin